MFLITVALFGVLLAPFNYSKVLAPSGHKVLFVTCVSNLELTFFFSTKTTTPHFHTKKVFFTPTHPKPKDFNFLFRQQKCMLKKKSMKKKKRKRNVYIYM